MTALVWLRRDLRPFDHPALAAAAQDNGCAVEDVTCVFVRSPYPGARQLGLQRELLDELNGFVRLRVFGMDDDAPAGTGLVSAAALHDFEQRVYAALVQVASECGARKVVCTRQVLPGGVHEERVLSERLAEVGIELVTVGTDYAVAPGELLNGVGKPYKVFTPFYKAWKDYGIDPPALPGPQETRAWGHWREFCRERLVGYAQQRDLPGVDGTSRIGAFLAVGALHPRSLVHTLAQADAPAVDKEAFVRELCFREFYAHFTWHRPETLTEDVNERFAAFDWDDPAQRRAELVAWQEGRTGFPIVDAGMRQLNQTGWMHNRVRMIVASFLTKDLHLPWQVGAAYFAQRLVDFDPANNQHSWQWTAGTGTDASPYFRVFNPLLQGEKFDPEAVYIKRFVPELAGCAPRDIHRLRNLPVDYPSPLVDHGEERKEALARYEEIKG